MVVDAVEGRFTKMWLKEMMKMNAMVIASGSKFYRGPPHSGAVFVPPKIMK